MKMSDSLVVRSLNRDKGDYTLAEATGVFCTVTDALKADMSGFLPDGQIVVRIPEKESVPVCCGDEISHDGGVTWFTVTEVRDNRRKGSWLSHRKVIGRR